MIRIRVVPATLCMLVAAQIGAQVLEERSMGSRRGGGPPSSVAPAEAGASAEASAAQPVMRLPIKKARPGARAPSSNPRDFAGVWISHLLQEQVVPVVKPALAGKVQTPKPSGFATPNLESRRCHPSPYLQGVSPYPMQIVQTEQQINFIYEENRRMRRIYLDGKLPSKPTPSHSGYSVGRWEGNTLVVETIGFKHTIDFQLEATPAIRVIERMRKIEDGTVLDIEVSYHNEREWASNGSAHVRYQWRPDLTLFELVCEEFSDAFGPGYDTYR